ncbi:MAG: hypothetical protein V3U92_01040 [Cellulophaga sp.]
MNKSDISREFQSKRDDYNRLGQNFVDALKMFLNDKEIPYLEIYHRVKKFDSFFEKIDRKGYSDPFTEIEDFCGIRIICYYASDLEKINDIINDEFMVLEQQDKSKLLGLKEFAYRSNHYITSVKGSWLAAPNYRKLEGLKSEIQVRTILMHAWAEIEHKLNYKNDAQVPDKFQRKLFRLSAKFEEADEQFEELKIGIEEYNNSLSKKIKEKNEFSIIDDFNIDSFKTYLSLKIEELNHFEPNFSDAFDILYGYTNNIQKIKQILDFLIKNYSKLLQELSKTEYGKVSTLDLSEIIYLTIDIIDPELFKERAPEDSDWVDIVENWQIK